MVLTINTFTGTAWAKTSDSVNVMSEMTTTDNSSNSSNNSGTQIDDTKKDTVDETVKDDSKDMTKDDAKQDQGTSANSDKKSGEEKQDTKKSDEETKKKEGKKKVKTQAAEVSVNNDDTEFLSESSFLAMCDKVFGTEVKPMADDIVYVAGNGVTENTADKGSYANPWGSLSEARAANTSKSHVIYYLLGDYTSSEETTPREPYTGQDVKDAWPNYSQSAIIVSQNDKAYLSIDDTWNITGNVGFYRTSIHLASAKNVKIYCNGNKVVFGGEGMDNISVTGKDSYYPTLFGGGNSEVSSTDLTVNGGTWARIYGAGEGANGAVTGKAKLTINGKVQVDESGNKTDEPTSGKCSIKIVSNSDLENAYINMENICGGAATTGATRPEVGSSELNINYLNYGTEYSNNKNLYIISSNGGKQGNADLNMKNSTVSKIVRGLGSSKSLSYTVDNVKADVDMTYQGSPTTIGGINDGMQSGAAFTFTAQGSTLEHVYEVSNSNSWNECRADFGKQTYNIDNTVINQTFGSPKTSTNGRLNWEDSELNLSGEKTNIKDTIYAFKKINIDGLKTPVAFGSKVEGKMSVIGYDGYYTGWNYTGAILLKDISVNVKNGAKADLYQSIGTLNLLGEKTSANVYDNVAIDTISGSGQLNVADNKTATVKAVKSGSSLKAGPAGEINNSAMIVGQFTSTDGSEFAQGDGCYTDQSPYFIAQPGTGSSTWLISADKVSALDATHIYVNQASGSDENSGGKLNPVKTLAKAFEKVTEEKSTVVLQSIYMMGSDEQFPSLKNYDKDVMVTLTADDGETSYKSNALLVMPSNKKIGCDMTIQDLSINGKTSVVTLYTMDHKVIFEKGASCAVQGEYKLINIAAGAPKGETVDKVNVTINEWNLGMTGNTRGNANLYVSGIIGDSVHTTYNANEIVTIKVNNILYGQLNLIMDSPEIYGSCSIKSSITSNQNLDFTGKVYGDLTYDSSGYNYYQSSFNLYCAGKMTIKGSQNYGASSGRITGTYLKGIQYDAEASGGNPLYFSDIKLGGDLIINGAVSAAQLDFKNIQDYSDDQKGNIVVNHSGTCKVITCADDTSDKLTVNVINDNSDTSTKKKYNMMKVSGVGNWKQDKNTEVEVTKEFIVRNCELKENSILDVCDEAENTFGVNDSNNKYTLKMEKDAALKLVKPLRLYGNLEGTDTSDADSPYIEVNGDTVDTANEENCSRITGNVKGNIRLKTNYEYEDTLKQSQKIWLDQETADTNSEKTTVTLGNKTGTFSAFDDTMNVSSKQNSSGKYEVYFGGPDRSVIYINSDNGDDTNLGINPEKPVKTLDTAFEKVLPGGTIVVQNKVQVSAWPNLVRTVHISSYDKKKHTFYKDGILTLPRTLSLVTDLYLECLTVEGSSTTIRANGGKIVIGVNNEELPVVKDENGENIVHNLQGTIKSIVGMNPQTQIGSDIEVHSGQIDTVWVIGDGNDHPKDDAAIKPVYKYTMTGGTVKQLTGDDRTDPSKGQLNYKLSGGKIDTCYLGRTTANYGSPIQISAVIEQTFSFDNLYCTSKHYHANNGFSISFENWNKDSSCDGKIYVGRENTTASCTDNIDITNSVIPSLEVVSNSKDEQNLTIDLNLKEGAQVKKIVTGNADNKFESIKTFNINVLGKDASVGLLKNYGNGTSKISQIQNVNINISNGVENTLDFLKDVRTDLDYRPTLNVTEKSTVIFPASLKENGTIAQISSCNNEAGSSIYLPKSTTLKADYKGASKVSDGNKQDYAYLYTNNGAILTVTGTVTGYTQLRTAILENGSISENKDGFINGVNVFGALEGSREDALDIYSEYEKGPIKNNILTRTNENAGTREWKIEDSTDTQYRNTIYVNGSEGSNEAEGTYLRPVKTLSKAYEKAAVRYKEMYELIKSSDDQELIAELKKNLAEGITIYVDGSITLGDMKDANMLSAINEAETLSGLTDIKSMSGVQVEGIEDSANIQFSDNSSEYILPIQTTLQAITLQSSCASISPELIANGKQLNVEPDVTCSYQNKGFIVYGGGKVPVETAIVNLNGGNWETVYGGSKEQTVDEVELSLGGKAKANKVYGGGYETAAKTGKIKLAIDGGTYGQVCGGGFSAVSGEITLDMISGTVTSLYGSGEESSAEAQSGKVTIGGNSEGEKAFVTSTYRGAGVRTGFKEGNTAITVLKDGCILGTENNSIDFCGGGYSGTVSKTNITIDGGIVYGNIHAGGFGTEKSTEYGNVNGDTEINVNGGNIYGNIFGGGNNGRVLGTANVTYNGGKLQADKAIYGGGNAADVKQSIINVDGTGFDGTIYGGSYQITNEDKNKQTDAEIILNNSVKKVFGGSNMSGDVSGIISITVPSKKTITADAIYGGGNLAETTGKTKVNVEGNYTGNIFGGGKGELKTKNGFARVLLRIFTESDLIDAHATETNVTVNGSVTGDVFGGGEYATVGTTDENADQDTLDKNVSNVTINGTVNGKVYGGGKGEKDKNYAAVNGSTSVILGANGKVTVDGDAENAGTGVVFGGGQNAPVAGNTNVSVQNGTYSTIFGGNDVSGEIQGKTNVNVTGGEVAHIYGAGRDAAYTGTGANVTADSKANVSEIYGGGYGQGAKTDNANVSIRGGTVKTAYAGGNAAATKDTEISVTGGQTDTVFGGGNAATITGSSKVTVDTADDTQHVDTVFAGNNKAAMGIKPTLEFADGKIGTVYCGGNQGIMTYHLDTVGNNGGISYTFDYPKAEIGTVFAGCNNTSEQTEDVELTMVSGEYGTVYGGNNQTGNMEQTSVIVDASKDSSKALNVDTIYGGGNQADAVNTSVDVRHGEIPTVYGGGNAATVTDKVEVKATGDPATDKAQITDLYCGNNEAEMALQPVTELENATISHFYGGGNQGVMTKTDGLEYAFDSDNLTIDTIYGGGNEAGVTQSVTLNVAKGNYTNIYGGSNSKGTVDTANVNIKGNVGTAEKAGKVFGGGRGSSTVVNNTKVSLQSGTITGNVYGGSGFGNVGTANVSAQESEGTVKVNGNIYGAGYGVTSSANDTNVNINLNLSIKKDDTGDVKVDEVLKSDTDKSGESKATATWKRDYKNGSYVSGNVFGGGDMGQVGKGYINTSTNTAVIEKSGKTTVNVGSGYIHGNIFGGGNGQPGGEDESGNAITEYTVYMGTVFGTSNVNMTGGYVNGNVFGCGQQSRTYSDKNASNVKISTDNTKPILIGGSIFGGGNKGNGTTQNASVATVYGDTHVTLQGMKNQYTQIYLLSNGTSGGGVYGDGNLCLVSGKKYVTLENFSCGVGANVNLLKTFYSLQRADVVDIIASRIVLKGAVDLVAENADDTVYSINRASQVNLKESSTIKVTKTVNLLGELTSDEQTGRQFIDRGNNNGNANITGNDYTGHGGKAPENPLTKGEITSYINEYNKYSASGTTSGTYQSINVVCVANGGYLEVKKNSKDYGPVTGLFTLQLVNANPGEGGGFIYADIMGRKIDNKYVTGNFVCVTKQSESSNDYMYAYHNVGGQFENNKYEYYVWYLKGNKYSYDVDLTSYIGTKDTEFTKTVSLATEPDAYSMILTQLNQTKDLSNMDLNKMYQNTWASSDDGSDKFAVEVTLITKNRENSTITTSNKSIGYIGYQTTSDTNPKAAAKTDSNGKLVWGIWRSDGNGGWKFQACKGTNNSFTVEKGDALAQTDDSIVSAQMKFTLHKGTGMTTEFRNLPFEMIIAEAKTADYNTAVTGNSSIQEDSCIRLTTNLNLSAIRLVPTQAAYMGSGRMFAGVSSSSNVNITKTSAFTAQFVTKYIPSAFNTGSTNQIKETLTTKYDDIYLWDTNGVGYTIKENSDGKITVLNVVNSNDPDVKSYKVTKSGSDYSVSYLDVSGNVMTDADGKDRIYDCKVKKQSSGFTLPKGTMITMLASLDEDNPTYWYYYCTKDTSEVQLEDFKEMNTSNEANSDRSVYDTIFTTSSSRVTENMIFVFDFEKVSDSDWSGVNAVEGNVQLKHTYKGGSYTSDIMDYVSAESKTNNGTTTTSYQREMPRQTETFKISKDSDGITNFGIRNADESNVYGQKEKMKFNLNITPDTNVTNTQYEEREYAVILTLRKKGETSEIAFPEGTTFTFNNEKLSAGKDNKYVIVPVKTVGTHEVEIQSKLAGFDADNYELVAKLYSTSEEGYYNSIKITTDESTHADFRIKADPTYALQVKEHSAEKNVREKNHFAKAGETFDFTVTAMKESGTETGESAAESDAVSVGLYRYDQGAYTNVALDSVLDGTPDLKNGQNQSWAPAVKSGAKEGTYRLEFTYHDKTEYWDFMVMP